MDPVRNETGRHLFRCCSSREATSLTEPEPVCKDSHHFPQEDSAPGRQRAGEPHELGKHVSQSQITRQLNTSQHGSHFRDPRAWGQTMGELDEKALTKQRKYRVYSPGSAQFLTLLTK